MTTYVVCEPCRDCKYTDCVVVCPVECFYQDEHLLYIDPSECVICDACKPECPVDAIFLDTEVPAPWRHFTALNAERSTALKASGIGHIRDRQQPKLGAGCTQAH